METAVTEPDADLSALARLKQAHDRLREQLGRVVVGQQEVLDQLLIGVFARGHCMLEGVPGLAKTLIVSTLSRCLSLDFSRIQFTPDLMPSDVTGTEVLHEDRASGMRQLRFVPGPIFGHVVLADEINRTPPKTQAALLEAMQEHQVTAGGKRHALPSPFFVLATQNPIEQEGTYPLPEAQLDRFLLKIHVRYPSPDEERQIYRQTTGIEEAEVVPVLGREEILEVQTLVRRVPIGDYALDYALELVRATRPADAAQHPKLREFVPKWIAWGAGPRAGQALVLAAKARAALAGRTQVAIEDVRALAHPTLRHRLVTTYAAQAEGQTPDTIIDRLLDIVTPHANSLNDGQVARVFRS